VPEELSWIRVLPARTAGGTVEVRVPLGVPREAEPVVPATRLVVGTSDVCGGWVV
jgi:hypothetical protein